MWRAQAYIYAHAKDVGMMKAQGNKHTFPTHTFPSRAHTSTPVWTHSLTHTLARSQAKEVDMMALGAEFERAGDHAATHPRTPGHPWASHK